MRPGDWKLGQGGWNRGRSPSRVPPRRGLRLSSALPPRGLSFFSSSEVCTGFAAAAGHHGPWDKLETEPGL